MVEFTGQLPQDSARAQETVNHSPSPQQFILIQVTLHKRQFSKRPKENGKKLSSEKTYNCILYVRSAGTFRFALGRILEEILGYFKILPLDGVTPALKKLATENALCIYITCLK